jgi:DNA polymerase-3 subunit delta
MHVNLDQLPAALQRGLASAYLVSGEEFLLVGEAADAIRAAARAQGYGDRRVYFVDRSFSWDQLRNDSQALSLFADRRLFELRLPSGKPDKKSMDAPWVRAFSQHGVWVAVRSVGEAGLPAWLATRARRAGFTLEEPAAQLIAERTEGNLLAADQELAKLGLLAKDGRIDAPLVLQAVGDSARYDVLQLSAAAAAGDAYRAVHIFHGLKREGVEPTLILWALVREVRGLWQASERNRLRSGGGGSNWSLAARPSERALSRLRSLPLPALLAQAALQPPAVSGRVAR